MARQAVTAGAAMKAALFGAVMLSLGACTSVYQNHGYVPSEQDLAALQVGQDTRESVAEAVGTPSAGGVLDGSGYYYVSKRERRFGPFEPEIVDRQVVAIRFDAGGRVSNIERFTLEDGRVVALSRRVTNSNVEGVGFLQQLMGSLGNIDAGQFLD
ncbi:hypothetical protein CBW24_10780 [Pacificitalea manganoxidans]|uniref:Outer membrane protein assembly factor BamE domain-containing protein n=1 Tax=Pacificitalea manganoxidans TaxID=1411902 RepID=A0A291M0I0_9RHOB|nr:outer membrane protein assembly factor BamE [Pacificitalea manganoxidans]MAQ46559.1 outer membrane protein assembly factor BamE [Actibacterium sp.]OWU71873.1 hypothetical protein ATO2_00520 [Roseovarius sp. 22II1-1F6A]ATI42442.1 hypothetical protein CBW24_10780 [Pacificitalea manganoxidans]MBF53082.1 outer membrane protein assembly factor BamE [Actibacterium sp.]MDR6307705.1 outer membrane protein assembly factor BamE (lipoprotein component of BamABCDE complex) [Pacificitalea manganoxidans]|tara:strand:+ start:535 stop:1002 length:468 start_codon:yes stop_codon:yes gene_type:complete